MWRPFLAPLLTAPPNTQQNSASEQKDVKPCVARLAAISPPTRQFGGGGGGGAWDNRKSAEMIASSDTDTSIRDL